MDATILKPAVATIDQQFRKQPLVDAYLRQTLAGRYSDMALYEAALPLQKSALATRSRQLGADNPVTLESMRAMGYLFDRLGRPGEGEPFAREAADRSRRVLGEYDPATLQALSILAIVLYDDGRLAEAETYDRETLAIQRRVLGEDNPQTLSQLHNLGLLLMYQHKNDEAEPFLRDAAARMSRVLGADNGSTLLATCNLGYLLIREGKLEQAQAIERDALARSRRALGEDHPVTLVATALNAMILEKQGAYAQSEQLLVPIDAAVLKAFTGSNLFLRATYLMLLGKSRTGEGRYAAAETALLQAQDILQTTHNVTHADDVRDTMRALVALYTSWNKAEPGNGYDAKAADWEHKLDRLGPWAPK
jgi:hypothetical protein